MFIENATVHASATGNNRLELNLSDVSDNDLVNLNAIYNTTRRCSLQKTYSSSWEETYVPNFKFDINSVILHEMFGIKKENNTMPYIKKVIFNNPATIVFWSDGTKTVSKAHGEDKFDKEIGLTVCIAKKALGNRRHFDAVFKKWIKN